MTPLTLPPIPEFVELVSDSGTGLYACRASVDMVKLTRADFADRVDEVLTVGEFYELAAGGEIIFT
ncbi:MAG: DsrE/DsrF/DrsH-like family protein [Solirubrobacteraceae bacterium]